MRVYIVLHGENGEGGTIMGAFTNKKAAKERALGMETCFAGGWKVSGKDEWKNGCDRVSIKTCKMED